MKKNRIRLTESQLHSIIKKSVKSFINEGGHLTWKDDDGRMHTNSQDNWYGIEGATFVSHGAWSDGEIYFDYEGEQYVINANDAEEWLWNDFKEYCEENNLNPDEHSDDEIWYNFARNEGYDVLLNLGPYNESYEMNESKKRKVRLTESQLHGIIKESVKRILNEGVQDIVAQLSQLEDRIGDISREIKRVFFEYERRFDDPKYTRFVRMGLDNPPYSFGTQGELSKSFDAEKWNEWTRGRGPRFEDELRDTYKWFKQLQYLAECEGYGPGAAARGFNVANPIGIFWSESSEAIRILNKMAELTNIKL